MAGKNITIKASDGGTFGAYLALPKRKSRGPGILVIQEIFGVNKVMRDLADGFAAQGYVALCPDLFWRQEPGIQLTDKSEAEWQRAFQLFQGFNVDLGMADLVASLDVLRAHPACNGRVGAVGYCLGGKLAYLMAARTACDAAVGYYGVGIEGALDEARKIDRPLLLHIAALDKFCPPEAQKAVIAGLKGKKGVATHVYPGVDHAFARQGGEHYSAKAAKLANDRTAAFFKKHLAAKK
jgi:carboxymethylenebutenolidase